MKDEVSERTIDCGIGGKLVVRTTRTDSGGVIAALAMYQRVHAHSDEHAQSRVREALAAVRDAISAHLSAEEPK